MPLNYSALKYWKMNVSVNMEPSVCILATLFLLTLPLKWLFAAIIAAAFHELCHITALRLLKYRIWNIRIGIGGTQLETEPLSRGKELLCALSGPLGSFLLLSMINRFPRIAVCAGLQGIYNLLPIYPLDGGRIFRCIIEACLPGKYANTLCTVVENVTIAGIVLLPVVVSFYVPLGIFPLILAAGFVLKILHRKIPCKASQLKVQ